MKWYKRDPEAFAGGTAELSLEEVGAYTRVIDAYYARDGKLPDDDYLLSRILRCNPRTWRKLKFSLFKLQKLTVDDGLLIPNRGISTLKEARTFSERQSNRVRKRWEGGEKHNENNITPIPSTTTTTSTTTVREEKCKPPSNRKGDYTEQFEKEFWSPYPRSPNMSKKEAWDEWKKLSSEDKEAAIGAVCSFKEWASKQRDYTTLHANRFLKKRRFDGFQPSSNIVPLRPVIHVQEGTPEMEAWDRYCRQTTGKNAIRSKHGGLYPPSQWPPGEPDARNVDAH